MKRFIFVTVVAVFLTVYYPTVFAKSQDEEHKVKHSKMRERDRSLRHGENVKQRSEEKDKEKDRDKERQKDSRDANESQKSSMDKEKGRDKVQEYQQQLKTLEEQITDEQTKFADRKAKLEHKKAEAQRKGDTETVERTDDLMRKEQEVYDRRIRNMEEKRQKILELAQQQSDKDANKPKVREKPKPPQDPNAGK